jgi:hypothetical protein
LDPYLILIEGVKPGKLPKAKAVEVYLEGKVMCHKARLVTQGFLQMPGIDFKHLHQLSSMIHFKQCSQLGIDHMRFP